MQPNNGIETAYKLDALQELYKMLSNPALVPVEQLVEELTVKGYSKEDIQVMLEIGTDFTATKQKLAAYTDEQNRQLIQKNFEITMEGLEELKKSAKVTMDLSEKLKKSLITNATGTLSAFNRVITIYTIAFIVGILLIATAVVFGTMGKTVLAVAFGTLGIIDIVTYFIKLPANKIQESRSNLSQLQVVLLVWLKEFVNNDALCGRILNGPDPSLERYKILSQISIDNTANLLKLIEDWAEPKN